MHVHTEKLVLHQNLELKKNLSIETNSWQWKDEALSTYTEWPVQQYMWSLDITVPILP